MTTPAVSALNLVPVRAGHTSVSVVLDRYGHLFPQHEDALLQALEYPPSAAAAK